MATVATVVCLKIKDHKNSANNGFWICKCVIK